MEEHSIRNNPSESSSSDKVGSSECYRYKKEIDEILREESEFGLAKTMSPDEHLIPNGSNITYSQFKNDVNGKNLKYKTSTLKVDTQELSNGVSQFLTTNKQLCTHNMQNKSYNKKLKQYTPKSISYIKRILETTKNIMPSRELTDNIVCVFDSSETKSGLDENTKETDKKENGDVKCVIQQNKNLQNIKNSISYSKSSETSIISNSSRSNENKTYNNKRSASGDVGLVKRRCSRINSSHSHIRDIIENKQVDDIQHQTVHVAVNVNKRAIESRRFSPLQDPNNLETNKNLKKCVDVLVTNANLFHDKRLEFAPEAGSSQVNNENIFTNKTSELSEICPKVNVEIVKLLSETLQSHVNHVSAKQDKTFDQREVFSNQNSRELAEKSGTDLFSCSKSIEKTKNKNDSVTDTGSKTHKILASKATKKYIKYEMLQNIFKLLLKSPLKNGIIEFIKNDPEIQQLLKGWKLNMNVEKDPTNKIYSKNVCNMCRNHDERVRDNYVNNLQEECVSSDIILCAKATQTELSLTNRDKCASRLRWINESCSDSEDLDLNLLL